MTESARLPDPARSRMVLVGAGRFEHLAELPAVAANLAVLRQLFTSQEVWGLPPDHCRALQDPASVRDVSRAVRAAAEEATDTLVFYYAGHGLIDPTDGELHLAVRDSQPDAVYDTALPYDWIRRALVASPAVRRVVILDCCYSGRVLGTMAEGLGPAEIDGTYLLAATAENAVALAPPGEPHTAFTGGLVELLRRGLPEHGSALSLNQLYHALRSALGVAGRPRPQSRDRNNLGNAAFVPNAAARGALVPARRDGRPLDPREAALRRFVADLTHELRTPMTAIRATAEALGERVDEDHPAVGPGIALLVRESRRMGQLLESMMELVRFDAGTARQVVERVELTRLLRETLGSRGWDETVTLRAAGRPVLATLDPRRLDVIVAELLSNALAHGRPPCTLDVTAPEGSEGPEGPEGPEPERFGITVRDAGPGVPESELPFVFDRFFRGARRPGGGAGLGLALALENAQLMGGTLTVANDHRGAGTVCRLELPVNAARREAR